MHRSVEPAGRVRRIAAAVLVDDAVDWTEVAGKRTSTRRKRTADEMKEIEQLARAAIGVDTQRGDVLAVENLSFQEMPIEVPPPPTQDGTLAPFARALDVDIALRRPGGFVPGGLLPDFAAGEEAGHDSFPRVAGEDQPSFAEGPGGRRGRGRDRRSAAGESQRATQLKKLLTEKVKAEPAAASRLVETWVREGEDK